ncbi:DUF5711 family protein [Hespellia stercorisuis]|uniref:Uncharacterized protein n=1 Tax=Hespellia stercorisuis DSM 15480 TaxID=1121950 RepID=A0A1M6P5H9_9FIRM|nr:DUF5711 family protein [Hespellia stercorisuis]SHK03201.1 hypothetical protein SAMN02745243_02023 [Hespellia stercorisuis DSM 15480]
MAGNDNIKLYVPGSVEEIEEKAKHYRQKKYKKYGVILGILLLFLGIAGIALIYQKYTSVSVVKTYSNQGADNNSYAQFATGVVRYSRDGVVFLNRKNEELWNQPCQIQNPVIDVNEEAFAIGDVGGTSILVFTKDGLKGEIETTLPIEKLSVSDQGIVSAILKNESSPKIITYDAVGNVLVEHQIDVNKTGYPVAVSMSSDANLLSVSYLNTQTGILISKVGYYNFGTVGQDKTDNQVTLDEYNGVVMADLFFMDADTSVAVGDDSFVIYRGKQTPEASDTIKLKKEVVSAFHSDKYIGFILRNADTAGYELCAYNKNGRRVMSVDFTGEYAHIKISGRQVIMYEGSKACIYTIGGIRRFKGDLGADASELIPVFGINKYLVINANEVKVIRLAK